MATSCGEILVLRQAQDEDFECWLSVTIALILSLSKDEGGPTALYR
jgi:hypothetical protein